MSIHHQDSDPQGAARIHGAKEEGEERLVLFKETSANIT